MTDLEQEIVYSFPWQILIMMIYPFPASHSKLHISSSSNNCLPRNVGFKGYREFHQIIKQQRRSSTSTGYEPLDSESSQKLCKSNEVLQGLDWRWANWAVRMVTSRTYTFSEQEVLVCSTRWSYCFMRLRRLWGIDRSRTVLLGRLSIIDENAWSFGFSSGTTPSITEGLLDAQDIGELWLFLLQVLPIRKPKNLQRQY